MSRPTATAFQAAAHCLGQGCVRYGAYAKREQLVGDVFAKAQSPACRKIPSGILPEGESYSYHHLTPRMLWQTRGFVIKKRKPDSGPALRQGNKCYASEQSCIACNTP